MDFTYLALFLVIALSMTYVVKNTFFPQSIIDNGMKEIIKQLTEQCLKENGMDKEWRFSQVNEIKYYEENKEIKVQVFILKTS